MRQVWGLSGTVHFCDFNDPICDGVQIMLAPLTLTARKGIWRERTVEKNIEHFGGSRRPSISTQSSAHYEANFSYGNL